MFQVAPAVWFWPRPSSESVALLLLWNCGSRHDPPGREGLLHFVEHTLFKGTQRHRGRTLFQRVERTGGELNAFTTKDKMGLEARVAPSALGLALSTLYELAHDATFPLPEVEKEREVILEELAMYEDIPEESLLDHFEEQVFSAGGLRHPIIGYRESLCAISSEELRAFYRQQLQRVPWVLLVSGPLTEQALGRKLRATGWDARASAEVLTTLREEVASPSFQRLRKSTQQAHLVVGGLGPSPYAWAESLPLQLMLHELAGPQMSSRLNTLLRERYGWGYSVYGFYHGYPERSVWGVYAGLTPEVADKAEQLIRRELLHWCERPISEVQLHRIKRAFLGRQALAWEQTGHRLYVQGRFWLDRGKLFEPTDWRRVVEALTPADVQAAAQEAFGALYVRRLEPQAGST